MTACFKLVRSLQSHSRLNPDSHCAPCVYFGKNLDGTIYPVPMNAAERCGLGFLPGDGDCNEMRTDNCSVRKK